MEKYILTDINNLDDCYTWMEKKIKAGHCFIVEYSKYKNSKITHSLFLHFVDVYKPIISDYKVDFERNEFSAKPKNNEVSLLNEVRTYGELQESYSEDYYLADCGGYGVFAESAGRRLDGRLLGLLNVVEPEETDCILDIGCGRGEFSYQLSRYCRKVLAVDYSSDAISIAKAFFTRSNLQYTCADVLSLDEGSKYDKIIMADVYEHIENTQMLKLLKKIAGLLTENGKLFIHTAPNLDFYNKSYPRIKVARAQEQEYIPVNPRSYYEQLMHINEQSLNSLYTTLVQYFSDVRIWEGSLPKKSDINNCNASGKSNDLWAVAANSNLDDFVEGMYSKPIDLNAANLVKITIKQLDLEYCIAKRYWVPIRLENTGGVEISSKWPYPVFVSYHVYNTEGKCVVHDGVRSKIYNVLRPGKSIEMFAEVDFRELEAGEYYIMFSLVQENIFWFESRNMLIAEKCKVKLKDLLN